jgi:hypothetical protein
VLVDDQVLFPNEGTTVSVEQGAEWAPGAVWTNFRISSAEKINIHRLPSP